MKYMHFNSACSYAGLANQLEMVGIDTEDTEIVTKIGLPYFIEYDVEEQAYLAGPMLQGKKWFDRYLSVYGKEYRELYVPSDRLLQELKARMMLGIRVKPGQKHAVIFLEKTEDGSYLFLNNKWETSEEPERLCFSEAELLERVPEQVVLGFLEDVISENMIAEQPENILQGSTKCWERYWKEISAFVVQSHTPEEFKKSMNPLFRPLLVDVLSMMQVTGEEEMVNSLKMLQGQYLAAVRKNEALILAEEMDMELFEKVVGFLMENIRKSLSEI